MNNTTVISKYTTNICELIATPKLKEYILEQNQWDDSTMSDIDWTAHSSAINYNSRHKTQITKLVHDLVPRNSLISKFKYKGRSTLCPLCKLLPETRDHIIRCPPLIPPSLVFGNSCGCSEILPIGQYW